MSGQEPDPHTIRWKFTIEYCGSGYFGWQRQDDDTPTIQQAIEDAIKAFCGQEDVRLQVAGRTDAGVHALGQVAHADLAPFSRNMNGYEVAKAINAHLRPQAISVIAAEHVSTAFHARHLSKNKLYRYRIVSRQGFLTLDQGLAWHIRRDLNVEAMHTAAQILLGHHDFSTFRDAQCQAASPMKTLDRLDVFARDYDGCGGSEILVETEAKSFLHHMVRNMVGTLVMVGEGKWRAADLKAALEAKDRRAGGPTAPADGLYMVRVDYEDSK